MFYDANIGKDGEKGRTCSGMDKQKALLSSQTTGPSLI